MVRKTKSRKTASRITRTIQQDPETGELMLDLGLDVCRQLGWKPGDTIEWTKNKDESWTLTRRKT